MGYPTNVYISLSSRNALDVPVTPTVMVFYPCMGSLTLAVGYANGVIAIFDLDRETEGTTFNPFLFHYCRISIHCQSFYLYILHSSNNGRYSISNVG